MRWSMKTLMYLLVAGLLLGCGGKSNNGDEDTGTEDTVDDTTVSDVETEDTGAGDTPLDTDEDVVTDSVEDTPADPGEEEPAATGLRFANIDCLPDVGGGEDVVEGQSMTCRFEVLGESGRRVTLSCEDESGTAIDCSSSSPTQIQPFGSNPIPVINGWFGTGTDGLADTTIVIVWVADDTVEQARHRFEADVVADDGTNGPPEIDVTCGGDSDGTIDVTAGDRMDCTLTFTDPDPDDLDWDYTQTAGATPVTSPGPYGGLGRAPYSVAWRWQTDSSESGTYEYTFSVDDGTAPAVTFVLTVNVS
jgi:hypothetical protein